MNPPFAGVTAVYAREELRSSTCTTVLPMCSSDTVTRDYFHGQLAFGVNSDLRCEGREADLEHVAGEKRGSGL